MVQKGDRLSRRGPGLGWRAARTIARPLAEVVTPWWSLRGWNHAPRRAKPSLDARRCPQKRGHRLRIWCHAPLVSRRWRARRAPHGRFRDLRVPGLGGNGRLPCPRFACICRHSPGTIAMPACDLWVMRCARPVAATAHLHSRVSWPHATKAV